MQLPDYDREMTKLVSRIALSSDRQNIIDLCMEFAQCSPVWEPDPANITTPSADDVVFGKIKEMAEKDASLALTLLRDVVDLSQTEAEGSAERGVRFCEDARIMWRIILDSAQFDTDLTRLRVSHEVMYSATTTEMQSCAGYASLAYAEKLGPSSKLAFMHSLNVGVFACKTENRPLLGEAQRVSGLLNRSPS